MDLGYVPGGVVIGGVAVGHDAIGGIAAYARLVPVWLALGIRADDESVAWIAATVSVGMGRASRAGESGASIGTEDVVAATKRGASDCDSLLRAVDYPQLRRLPSLRAAAFEFSARTLHRQQRKLR